MGREMMMMIDNEQNRNFKKAALSILDYMVISLVITIDPFLTYGNVYYMFNFGTVTYYVCFVFSSIIVVVPIVGFQLFMGEYLRMSYIKFWDICPAFRGIGYMVIISMYLDCSTHVYRIYVGMEIIHSCFQLPWMTCNFTTKDCIPTNFNKSFDKDCCENDRCTRVNFATVAYAKSNFEWDGTAKAPIYINFIIWFCIFLLCIINLKRVTKYARIMFIVLGVGLLPMIVITFIAANFSDFVTPDMSIVHTQQSDYWFRILSTFQGTLLIIRPGMYMFLSSRAIAAMEADSMSKMLLFFRIAMIGCFYLMCFVILDTFKKLLNIKHENCLPSEGEDIFYGALVAVMYGYTGSKLLTVLWFCLMIFTEVPIASLKVISVVQSLPEQHDIFKNRSALLAMIVCLIGYCHTMLHGYLASNETWWTYEKVIFDNVSFNMAILFCFAIILYGTENLTMDYQYFYGLSSASSRITYLKIAIEIIFVAGVVYWGAFFCGYLAKEDEYELTYTVVMLMIVLHSPIVVFMSYEIFSKGSVGAAFSPVGTFGPIGLTDHLQREAFRPKQVARYDSSSEALICNHNCLRHSVSLKKEIDYFRKKLSEDRLLYKMFLKEQRKEKEEKEKEH